MDCGDGCIAGGRGGKEVGEVAVIKTVTANLAAKEAKTVHLTCTQKTP